MSTRITEITPNTNSIHAYRIVKAYKNGFSIEKPKQNVYIKNIFGSDYGKNPLNDNCLCANTDKFRNLENMENEIDELMKNDIVLKNLNKNIVLETFNKEFNDELNTLLNTETNKNYVTVFYDRVTNVLTKSGVTSFDSHFTKMKF